MAIPLLGMAARAALGGGGRAGLGQAVGTAAGMAVGGAAQSATELVTPFTHMTAAFKGLNVAMSQAEAPFKSAESFFQHIGSYVQRFSPIRMEFFSRAVADFQAAIGKQLIPILEAGTRMFRRFGDMVVQLGPKMEPIVKAVVNLVDEIGKSFVDLAMDLADMPLLITATAGALNVFTKTMKTLLYALVGTLIMPGVGTVIGGVIGANSEHRQSGDASRGMAYQQTSTESVTSMIGRIQQEAFGYSGGPAEQTADNTAGMLEYFTGGDFVRAIANAIKEALSGGVGEAAQHGTQRIFGAAMGNDVGQMMGEGVRNFASDPLNFLRQVMTNGQAPIV